MTSTGNGPKANLLHQSTRHKSFHYFVSSFLNGFSALSFTKVIKKNLEPTRMLLDLAIEHVNLTGIVVHVLESLNCHIKIPFTKQWSGEK